MRTLAPVKTSALLLVSVSLLFVGYWWSKDGPTSDITERSSSLYPGYQWHLAVGNSDSSHKVPVSDREKRKQNISKGRNVKVHLPPEVLAQRKNIQLTSRLAPAILVKSKGGKQYDLLASNHKVQHIRSLSPPVINRVKKFLFFVGYARSGHSIIGTLLDAHPHVVISNEFNLFTKFPELNKATNSTWRGNLYNSLYKRSILDARGSRAARTKGYKLKVDGLWQGRFNKYIEVIGDKSGDITTKAYSVNRTGFLRNYKKLQSEVSIPLHVIHTVRNPFDMISTSVVIMKENGERFLELKRTFESTSVELNTGNKRTVRKYDNSTIVNGNINIFFRRIEAVMKLIEVFGRENVLDVHNSDLVSDPRGTMARILQFLGVDATEHYLDTCAGKVFKSVSRSRNMVGWTSEQIEEVEMRMMDYEVLERYSFTSN